MHRHGAFRIHLVAVFSFSASAIRLLYIFVAKAASVEQTRILSGLDNLSVRGYNELIVIIFSRAETEGEIEYEEYL